MINNIDWFKPTGASDDLLTQLNDVASEINNYRPLSDKILQRLQEQILYDRVYSSAVTEGNRLSKRETITVLTSGIIEAGSRKDKIEVKNLADAILQVEELIRVQEGFTPHTFRSLYHVVMKDIDNKAGGFRVEDVIISGARLKPPSYLEIPHLVDRIFSSPILEDSSISALQKAAWFHWAIARVHPFKDGNGRMARLLQDYILVRFNLVPSPLQPEDREGGYYAALEAADLGDGKPLLEIIGKNAIKTADKILAIIREEQAELDWIAGITQAAMEKTRQTDHRRFLSTQRAANILKSEFYNITEILNENIPSIKMVFRDYGNLEFDKFKDIERFGSAKRTWLFGLEFTIEETKLRYIFWYGRHYPKLDTFRKPPSEEVILVSFEEEDHYYRLLDDVEEDRVSLREIIPNQGSFLRRRYNPIEEKHIWDEDVTAGNIVRDFLGEVLSRLGVT